MNKEYSDILNKVWCYSEIELINRRFILVVKQNSRNYYLKNSEHLELIAISTLIRIDEIEKILRKGIIDYEINGLTGVNVCFVEEAKIIEKEISDKYWKDFLDDYCRNEIRTDNDDIELTNLAVNNERYLTNCNK